MRVCTAEDRRGTLVFGSRAALTGVVQVSGLTTVSSILVIRSWAEAARRGRAFDRGTTGTRSLLRSDAEPTKSRRCPRGIPERFSSSECGSRLATCGDGIGDNFSRPPVRRIALACRTPRRALQFFGGSGAIEPRAPSAAKRCERAGQCATELSRQSGLWHTVKGPRYREYTLRMVYEQA